ncbi:MAG: hypothetical protein J07HQX50_01568 [Haloquadratum sp. J07HQX50]|nr:MAG: hypothetical protein J07HQX50_01568 [Haloquadratum sp. J07HQX50]
MDLPEANLIGVCLLNADIAVRLTRDICEATASVAISTDRFVDSGGRYETPI